MANKYWQGGAASIAQVNTFAFSATWEATDIVRVKIGSRVVDFVAGDTDPADIVANIVTAWTALTQATFPEFYEIIASANSTTLTLTARTAGVPFTATITPLETGGGGADDQRIEGGTIATTGTAATASSSPYDGAVAANWSGGSLPVDGDTLIFRMNNVDLRDGLDYSSMNLNVVVEMSYTGKIGRPVLNGTYPEYRRRYLRFGTDDSPAQTVTIGAGSGPGSGRINLDFGESTTAVVILNTGQPFDGPGTFAVNIKGTDAANTLAISKGSVGVAVGPYDIAAGAEETATFTTVAIGYVTNPAGDVNCRFGSGVTHTTIAISGGVVEIAAAATTINKTGGELTIGGSGVTIGTLNEGGGTTYPIGPNTFTTINLTNAGNLDWSRDMRAKVITNPVNCYGRQFGFNDPHKVTGSVVVHLEQNDAIGNLDLGSHVALTRGTP
jgi:hypothetical protein